MQALADAMEFPEYFGRNWDAVEECVRDLSWKPADGYLLTYAHAQVLEDCCPDDLAILADVARLAGETWSSGGIPFHALVIGSESLYSRVLAVLGQENTCWH